MIEKIINKDEVVSFLDSWKSGVVNIGQTYTENNDFVSVAKDFISKHYNFNEGEVLFKPTFTKEVIFRNNKEDALSYFVKGNIPEDKGFAIQPWTNVRFENSEIIVQGNTALAMGNYYFTDTDGGETAVEYTFGYIMDDHGNLRINLHHSSVPFSG